MTDNVKRNRERKTGKEQYFTNDAVVDYCMKIAKPFIRDEHLFYEPCAGSGQFIKGYLRAGICESRIKASDLDPKSSGITKRDFLSDRFRMENFTNENGHKPLFILTNPPFGRASCLAIRFFNKLAPHAEYIGFLIPKAWRKWSVQNKLDVRYHLVADVEMPRDAFHSPDGEKYGDGLATIFQIWERRDYPREIIQIEDRGYFKRVAPAEADVALTGFGYSTGRVELKGEFVPEPNTTKYYLKVKDKKVITALKKIDVKRFSQNVAYTEVISLEELKFLLNEYFDKKMKVVPL